MHGQNPRWECPRIKCAFYAWEKMRIIYMGKPTHIMHGQTHGGNAHIFSHAFYAWGKKAHNIRGKKHAYYAWAKPTVGMPTHKMRILCAGKNAHTWANPRWECPHFSHAFYAWEKMRIIYVGKKYAYYAWANPAVGMPT